MENILPLLYQSQLSREYGSIDGPLSQTGGSMAEEFRELDQY